MVTRACIAQSHVPISLYIMHNHDTRYAVCTSMDLRDNKPFLSEQLAACVCVVEHSSGGTQQWWNTAAACVGGILLPWGVPIHHIFYSVDS